ncbi:glycoside hydrolase family 65 protein [Siphonobacter curvatus]|uniref:Family 65 glycosyl hydrolase n=1 Tax=Siphonobacter curvatus TaxID=2094562 RepID=A0A2S7IQE0_9BACT|nr:glycoside hydrolase family 65 protein [Siphonobacter curvatus]PQA59921.1 family 65 glycosyl hydrolase [Siphonobacter curvatus]
MKNYLNHDEWCIIEEGFHADWNEITESIMSLGNGRMGQRGNFEEGYSGKTLPGNYVAGVYFPDKTRVGWWKNGYPNYFAKVINAANWIGIQIELEDEKLDLANCHVHEFRRTLNMKEGWLSRSFVAMLPSGKQVGVTAKRFCSLTHDEGGVIRYCIKPLNFDGKLTIMPYIDGTISNRDSNYDQKFWQEIHRETGFAEGYLHLTTVPNEYGVPQFQVVTGQKFALYKDGASFPFQALPVKQEGFVSSRIQLDVIAGEEIALIKYACNLSDQNHAREDLLAHAKTYLATMAEKGYEQLLREQIEAWAQKWQQMDIVIEGDVAAQQAIRFNLFQLSQTYTGEDDRLNIGPKGFTGEKYGGVTYWDTEAYCIPFYLSTAEPKVARNLLIYRWKQLGKAIENAEKLGFTGGAALYPMVTMNGEECHNEWEITFEEIHRNGAIAYAIYDYIRYTGDTAYLGEYGFEVLLGIARFWSQRITWSDERQQFVMLGVTGPNEYENNVNNNWYTNYIARWCLQYTLEVADQLKNTEAERYATLSQQLQLNEEAEFGRFQAIIDQLYLPESKELGVFLQQDSYLDKEQILVTDLRPEDRPLNQKWSWDRILRSPFIKQADVLQGLYFFEDEFEEATIRQNYDYYEPRTVHESSLSPCVHAILASRLGMDDKAYEMYLRTSRLDLDDYNNDTEDGLHITSMAGTWMSVVKGFGGLRVKDGQLHLSPRCPQQWQSYSFIIRFRDNILDVHVRPDGTEIENIAGDELTVWVHGENRSIPAAIVEAPEEE